MILSASRRTDIPNYYSDWFYNRIKEGYVLVRNPMNYHQISKISLTPEVVDCIVFWTKNPKNMMARLDEIRRYNFYFQYTITGYGSSIEKNVPQKKVSIETFKELSTIIGKDKVVWRYDPIFISNDFSLELQLDNYMSIYDEIKDYTEECVISFIDIYYKNRKRIGDMRQLTEDEMFEFARKIPKTDAMAVRTCAEKIDLSEYGIGHSCCIDQDRIEKILGIKLKPKKDHSQRTECGCIDSKEIGSYNSCLNGCKYCYANYDDAVVKMNVSTHIKTSPLLLGNVQQDDKITERQLTSQKKLQYDIFDK